MPFSVPKNKCAMPLVSHLAPGNSSVYFPGTNVSYEQLRGLQGFSPLDGEVTVPLSCQLSGFRHPRPEPRLSVTRKGTQERCWNTLVFPLLLEFFSVKPGFFSHESDICPV